MLVKNFFLVLLIASFIFVGCGHDPVEKIDCSGITPTYSADIAPILNATCADDGCHGNVNTQAGIKLTNYAEAKAGSGNSKFLKAIKYQSGATAMPPDPAFKLSDAQVKLIECWIQNGKPE
ncbi:MAG: hypothetical protein IPL63_06345 [Saprospiraceae bacterium]|nr:hypothetical protein [Saprospiraceae bacterium]MBK8079368.1 hypothetical protein [Saprospiraceae bacterium]MBK8547000.1 hypothetical protein [Saprospiraceae bacterium]MBK8819485.1 hypothetical protein [Saprospiraceae bacterium]MBK9042007.1 hypothetical protein [Saprospiraceae bacterium]